MGEAEGPRLCLEGHSGPSFNHVPRLFRRPAEPVVCLRRCGRRDEALLILRWVAESALEEPDAIPAHGDRLTSMRGGARCHAPIIAGGEPGHLSEPGG